VVVCGDGGVGGCGCVWCVVICEQGQRYVEECMILCREDGGMCEGMRWKDEGCVLGEHRTGMKQRGEMCTDDKKGYPESDFF